MQTRKSLKSGVSFAALLSLALLKSQAQTTATWTGPASGGEWNTAASWSTLAVPGTDANQVTNVFVGPSTNVNYNLPMAATGFGTLTSYGVVNVNTNGFNTTGVLMLKPAGGDKLYVNAGGVMNVTGNLALCSNAVANVAGGGALNISGSLYIGSGATGGSSGGGVSSYGIMTNSGGILTAAATSLNIGNGSVTTSPLLVITGGTNNLGNVIVKRSNAGSGGYSTLGSEGLMIYGGLVNMTNLNVGGGNANSFLTTLITGGIVTNYGSVTINQGSAARGSRILQTGGLFVVPDPGVVNPNPTVTNSLNVYSVTGGTNIVGGFYFGNSNGSPGTVNFTNGASIYVGSQGLAYNGLATLTVALNNGGLFGATAPWTSSVAMKLISGNFTFQTTDPSGTVNNITLTGPLSGTGGLTKTGAGVLTLTATNSYTGNTVVTAGTLALGTDVSGSFGGIGSSPSISVGSSSTFDISGNPGYTIGTGKTIGGLGTVSGGLTAGSGSSISPAGGGAQGTLNFTGGLTASNANFNIELTDDTTGVSKVNDFVSITGDLNLLGTNNIVVTPVSGILHVGTYKLIGFTGAFNGDLTNLSCVAGTLSYTPGSQEIDLVVTTVRAAANLVWAGDGSANLWDTGVSSNWLNGVNFDRFYTGDTNNFTDSSTNQSVTISGVVTPGAVLVNSSSNYTFSGSGNISGLTGLTKSGTGDLTILTVNGYSGVTAINGGTLSVSNLATGGTSSPIGAATSAAANLVLNTGTLEYLGSGNKTTDHGATLQAGGGTFSVAVPTVTLTLSGTLTGAGALTKTGNGQLTLSSGANNYSGGTVIVAGGIRVPGTTTTPTIGTNVLTLNGGTNSAANFIFGSDAATLNNTVNVVGTNNQITSGGNDTVGAMTGSGTVNFESTGAQIMTVSAPDMTPFTGTIYMDTSVSNRLFPSTGTNLNASTVTYNLGVGTGALYNRNGGSYSIGALIGGSGTFLRGSDNSGSAMSTYYIGGKNIDATFAGTIRTGMGGTGARVTIVKVGTGKWTLTGANTYNGSTVVSNGVLALGDGTTDGSINYTTNINITATGIIDVSGRGDDTFQVGSSAYQLLDGRGTVNGSLNVSGYGTVAPGDGLSGSPGVLTVTNVITLNGTTWLKLNRGGTPASDELVSTLGSINYGGTLLLTNVGSALQPGDTFTLFSGSGLGAGTFGSVVLPSYYTFDTSNLGVNGTVTVTGTYKPALTTVDFSFLASGYLTFNAVNGAPNGGFAILTSTNAALPLSQWTSIATGTFDGSGNLSNQYVTVDPSLPQAYYVLQAQ